MAKASTISGNDGHNATGGSNTGGTLFSTPQCQTNHIRGSNPIAFLYLGENKEQTPNMILREQFTAPPAQRRQRAENTRNPNHQGPTRGEDNGINNDKQDAPEKRDHRNKDLGEENRGNAADNGENQDDVQSGLNSKIEERREKVKEDAPAKSRRQEKETRKAQSKKKNQEDKGESSESPQKSKTTYVADEDLEEKIAKVLKKLKAEELDIDDRVLKSSSLLAEIMEETIPHNMKLPFCQHLTEKET
ncbi:vicilin-like seed storage protein At2g18540 [Mercurialis annua]|uniref:vicilin-like seed storage protein At2g18540 n=1 Tax=Mercurialis annua TaxID=3986 RepID=UPI00215E41A5|nr:vicilin-like seed storage protein At2g18540 [Mercurialis annua]